MFSESVIPRDILGLCISPQVKSVRGGSVRIQSLGRCRGALPTSQSLRPTAQDSPARNRAPEQSQQYSSTQKSSPGGGHSQEIHQGPPLVHRSPRPRAGETHTQKQTTESPDGPSTPRGPTPCSPPESCAARPAPHSAGAAPTALSCQALAAKVAPGKKERETGSQPPHRRSFPGERVDSLHADTRESCASHHTWSTGPQAPPAASS